MNPTYNTPENFKFGGGAAASTMHPVVFVLLIAVLVLTFLLPRRYVVVPILLLSFLTPVGQQLYIAGLHFFVWRIVLLCAWLRILSMSMTSPRTPAFGDFNSIDKAFAIWAMLGASAAVLLFREMPAVINQCGFLIDAVGGYFLLRSLVRTEEDVFRVIKVFAVIVFILAVEMLVEKTRGVNLFGFIGGRLAPFVRDGTIRSQATFQGPIPAGTFAAPLVCLFVWLWKSGKAKCLGITGILAASVMVGTSASSTPLIAYMGTILGILMWPLRRSMRIIRWAIVLSLLLLHMVMKAPVWFLINHVDLVAGNSGYHRAILIDTCIRHFWDWWLIGAKSPGSWGWDLWDQANQFVAVAQGGGLAALIFFILIISRSFGRLGAARRILEHNRREQWPLWLLGAALLSHVVGFFGISYNDQTNISWYALLVMISAATGPILTRALPELDAAGDHEPSNAWRGTPPVSGSAADTVSAVQAARFK